MGRTFCTTATTTYRNHPYRVHCHHAIARTRVIHATSCYVARSWAICRHHGCICTAHGVVASGSGGRRHPATTHRHHCSNTVFAKRYGGEVRCTRRLGTVETGECKSITCIFLSYSGIHIRGVDVQHPHPSLPDGVKPPLEVHVFAFRIRVVKGSTNEGREIKRQCNQSV